MLALRIQETCLAPDMGGKSAQIGTSVILYKKSCLRKDPPNVCATSFFLLYGEGCKKAFPLAYVGGIFLMIITLWTTFHASRTLLLIMRNKERSRKGGKPIHLVSALACSLVVLHSLNCCGMVVSFVLYLFNSRDEGSKKWDMAFLWQRYANINLQMFTYFIISHHFFHKLRTAGVISRIKVQSVQVAFGFFYLVSIVVVLFQPPMNGIVMAMSLWAALFVMTLATGRVLIFLKSRVVPEETLASFSFTSKATSGTPAVIEDHPDVKPTAPSKPRAKKLVKFARDFTFWVRTCILCSMAFHMTDYFATNASFIPGSFMLLLIFTQAKLNMVLSEFLSPSSIRSKSRHRRGHQGEHRQHNISLQNRYLSSGNGMRSLGKQRPILASLEEEEEEEEKQCVIREEEEKEVRPDENNESDDAAAW